MNCNEEALLIEGPCGVLEAQLSCPQGVAPVLREGLSRGVAVIAHPHPLYGGTMHNKVVHYLARTLNQLGMPALRFNFRGVGKSEGTYADGVGEVDDLLAATQWLRRQFPGRPLWLAGFSFGAYVALRASPQLQPQQLITVAPPVNIFDLASLPEMSLPWLLLQGGADEVVPAAQVLEWAQGLPVPPRILYLEQAGHFFHGRLNELRDALLHHFALME